MAKAISEGTVHTLPADMRKALAPVLEVWEDITPLARNEWICWATSAKKDETREKRIAQMIDMLGDGKRRPCCWAGCPHR